MKDWAWGWQWDQKGRGGYEEPHKGGNSNLQRLRKCYGWGEGGAQNEGKMWGWWTATGWTWESVKRGGLNNLPANAGAVGSTPGMGRYPRKQMTTHPSILVWNNPMDRGAWRATMHGDSKSQRAEHDLATKVKWSGSRSVVSNSLQPHGL